MAGLARLGTASRLLARCVEGGGASPATRLAATAGLQAPQGTRAASWWAFWAKGQAEPPPQPPAEGSQAVSTVSSELAGGDGELEGPLAALGEPLGSSGAALAEVAQHGPVVSGAIGLVDALHAGTGLPWWGTLVLLGGGVRLSLMPLNLLQARAVEGNLKLWGQAQARARTEADAAAGGDSPAAAVPPEGAGVTSKPDTAASWRAFQQLRQERGAPSLWWIPGVPVIQIFCFASNALAVRSMAAQQWPGFTSEGLMWFTDLTQPAMSLLHNAAPMGTAGGLLPMAVLGVYLANIERSFGGSATATAIAETNSEQQSVMLWLRPKLRLMLEWLCVGMLWFGFQQPQALLLYVLSSASFALAQGSGPGRYLTRLAFGPMFGLPPPGQQSQPAPGSLQEDAGRSEAVRKLFQHAAELRAKEDVSGAVDVLYQLLEIEPRNARAYFALGKLHSKQKQWGESEVAYLKSVDLEEDSVQQGRAFFGAGIAFYNQEEYDVAADALRNAVERCPDDAEALLALSAALAKVGKLDEARTALTSAAERDPMVKEHLLEGLMADLDKRGRAAEPRGAGSSAGPGGAVDLSDDRARPPSGGPS